MARPRSKDDATLLDQAMRLFWRNGYASTGIRELEHALGLKAPALYNRFGSKDGLFQAALDHYLDAVIGWRISRYLEAPEPLAGLRKFFDTTYNYVGPQRPALSCLLVNTSLEIGERNQAVHRLLEKGAARLSAGIRANLNRAQQQGLIRPDADVPALAEHLRLCLHGLTVASRITSDNAKLARQVDMILAALPLTHPHPEPPDEGPSHPRRTL